MTNNIEFEIAPGSEAIPAISEAILEFFLDYKEQAYTVDDLENELDQYFSVFKENLYYLIEYPYVDKVYRNSYYTYFASKHLTYQRDCMRISMYSEEVTYQEFQDPNYHNALKMKFLGYFILRPTMNSLFGRSLISSKAFQEEEFKICQHEAECLIFGVKMKVSGFPHSAQDEETIKCAETTIWALMEYFGNKYADYKPVLPSVIHKTMESVSYQRQLPSDGLTMDQISFALKEYGFGTKNYSADQYKDSFFDLIDCYIESGIPVVAGLSSKGGLGHVIIVIGKENRVTLNFEEIEPLQYPEVEPVHTFFDTAQFPAQYVVQDDNLQPYRIINLSTPGEHYNDEDCQTYYIDSVVVPLYTKIYLEAYVAKRLMLEIIVSNKFGYKFDKEVIQRTFLASSRSFKNHICGHDSLTEFLKNFLLILKMPKFVWITEIYTKDGYNQEDPQPIGIVIVDATEANNTTMDALIFASYPDRTISANENIFVTLDETLANYNYYSNLK